MENASQISTESLQNMGLLEAEPTPVRVIAGGAPIPNNETVVIGSPVVIDSTPDVIEAEAVTSFEEEVICPDWLNGPSSTGTYNVELYAGKCLKCHMLVSTAASRAMRNDIPECHVQFGNVKCTAGTMQITLTGKAQTKIDDMVRKVEKARQSGDADLVQLAMTALFEQSEEVKRAVMARVGLI